MKNSTYSLSILVLSLLLFIASQPVHSAGTEEYLFIPMEMDPNRKGAFNEQEADERWHALSLLYFGERAIIEGDQQNIVHLEAPIRTENDAFVPVSIHLNPADRISAPIEKVYLIVDVNPLPIGGIFSLAHNRPLENISTRVRVNGYSYVRAIAETVDGELFMDRKLVKSRGVACAAPPITSPEDAARNLGKMRFKLLSSKQSNLLDSVQLMISHPNATGLQKDQLSLLYIPEHYVKDVVVDFNNETILRAQTTYTLSENPSFRFSFSPEEHGLLVATMTDTKDKVYVVNTEINSD